MKNVYIIIFATFLALNAQTVDQIKKQLKDAGVTPDQAKQMARDQSYPDSQIEAEARARGIDIDEPVKASENQTTIEQQKEINKGQTIEELTLEIENIGINTIASPGQKPIEYFGYQIFKGDPSAFQASTFGAVDPNYNIGPGDQIIVMLWGESQFRQEFTIDREGYVFVPEVGQVFVNGLNLDALEKKFFQIFSKAYSTLKPLTGKPTTFMDISLGDLRPLRIIVLGEVSQPGAYSISPSASLSSSLYYFRGPTTSGSMRDIRLVRKGEQVGSIDFYNYLLSGNIPDDLRLQLDDVVFIPPRGKTVTIHGDINRPGIYELKDTEVLKDLIQIAGNLPATAYRNRAQISRIVPVDDRSELGMDRIIIDIHLQSAIADDENTELVDGDVLEIFSIENLQRNYVVLRSSSVTRPGKYQLVQDMRVSDLIDAADGLLSDAYLKQAHIIRMEDDLTTSLISINLENVIAGNLDNNIYLKFMDELIIYNKNTLKNVFTNVFITGPVKNPGTFNLEANNKLGDLLLKAGGFNEDIYKVKISIARLDKNNFDPVIYTFPSGINNDQYFEISQLDDPENLVNQFELRSKDIINIYSDPKDKMSQIVHIYGAVYHPGQYPIISETEKVTGILNRAGGLLPNAYPKASTFIRNNNIVQLSFEDIIKDNNSKDNFKILDGDTIIINSHPNVVKLVGEIHRPGNYKFYPKKHLRDYIALAGGLTGDAELQDIWVTNPDGSSEQLKRFILSPKVYDGAVITVGKEKESDPIDKTELAKEIASIVADFLQIAMTLVILFNTTSGS